MRFPGAVQMAEGGTSTPIWARTNRGGGGLFGSLFMIIFVVMAALGALSLVLAIMNHNSFAAAGAQLDHWVAPVVSKLPGSK